MVAVIHIAEFIVQILKKIFKSEHQNFKVKWSDYLCVCIYWTYMDITIVDQQKTENNWLPYNKGLLQSFALQVNAM